jgi:hypothetical protein
VFSYGVSAAEIPYGFNSPAFSGAGYSSHVLTIKQLEDQAKTKNQQEREAAAAKAASEAANTPQAQFIANLQSRIYAQLSKQITDTLFGATGQPSCQGSECAGTVSIGGNTINWSLSPNGQTINVRITSDSNPSQYTSMNVPIGTFAF